ncbi:HAD-IA family hydrolase [Sabulicella glaciei]|uniref:Phosphoglycolate phosphatase n=1 Tax=Sabulicella glaciei TaxID=2984948 RepID=A0ABT3NSP5_9PROT|nr:HAD-IA family hydrolase [Roseococcus sp. MDT2-1-1]MCW8085172.1 HAD-IA family hydrolase [Roseococcus sp. MDT2-1-1]
MPLAIFDLDGTLVHSAPDIAAALNRLMARRALPPFALPEVQAMIGDGARALLAKAFAARGAAWGEEDFGSFLPDLEANSAVLSRPFPGIPEALAGLAEARWGLAVCTNKPIAATRALLEGLGLAGRFSVVLGGDSLSVRKPDPGHVRGVLEAAGAAPGEAVMIGDHANDVLAARGAGVRSVFAAWGYGADPGADAVAFSPAELLQTVR